MDAMQSAASQYLHGPVNLPQVTKSHYYRGLLVLLRRDRIIHIREKDLMLRIGEILGFDRRFCEATIDELLSNSNITREPVLFSDERIKECFFATLCILLLSMAAFILPSFAGYEWSLDSMD
jgi:hypothetical protein